MKTMLRLITEKDEVRVVDNQVGTPTWAYGFAQMIWRLVGVDVTGIIHWSDSGQASWNDFTMAAQEEALSLRMLPFAIPVIPISRTD